MAKKRVEWVTPEQALAAITPKQRRFIQEYLVDLNGTQAAIRAGYSKLSAGTIAEQCLRKPCVAAALEPLMAARAAKVAISAEQVIVGLANLANANMQDYAQVFLSGDLSSLTREQADAIQEMTVDTFTEGKGADAREVKRVRLKLANKLQARESIGKHLGMYIERKAIALGTFSAATDEQLDGIIQQLAAEIGIGAGARGKEEATRH